MAHQARKVSPARQDLKASPVVMDLRDLLAPSVRKVPSGLRDRPALWRPGWLPRGSPVRPVPRVLLVLRDQPALPDRKGLRELRAIRAPKALKVRRDRGESLALPA